VGIPDFSIPVQRAVDRGLAAAAVLDVDGKPFAVAGALDDDEARAVVAFLATGRLRSPDLLDRMLEGEMVTSSLDDREVSIGIAGRCVFVVVVLAPDLDLSRAVDGLRVEVEQMISSLRASFSGSRPPGAPSSGGSSSGPAELQLIEFGVTVPRGDRN
jgi:hypothetical protein